MWMKPIHSRITTQGQVSVPAKVRRALGVGLGAMLEWESHPDGFVVRRAGRTTTADIHNIIFGRKSSTEVAVRKTRRAASDGKVVDVKAAISSHIRKRHARG